MTTLLKTILLFLFINQFEASEWCINRPSLPFPQFMGVGTYKRTDYATDKAFCLTECQAVGYTYSALWKESLCFCTNDISSMTNATDSSPCTTTDGLLISRAVSSEITAVFEIIANPSMFLTGTNSVSMLSTVLTSTPPGTVPDFSYSYEDRSNIWETSSSGTTPIKRVFYASGVYEVKSMALKPGTQNKISEQRIQMLSYQGVSNVNLTCKPQGLVFTLVECVLVMGTGSKVSGKLTANNVLIESFSLPDFLWERGGSVPMFFSSGFVTGKSPAGIHIVNSVFQYPGVVTMVELYAVKTGSIDILLLKPTCPSFYCFANSACDTDPACSRTLTCPSDYCPLSRSCANSCNNRLLKQENITALPVDYTIEDTFAYTLPNTGYQVISLGKSWSVDSGYRLAFHTQSDSDVIAAIPAQSGEVTNFFLSSHTITKATKVTPATPDYVIHQFSAISQPQRQIKIKMMFNVTGQQSITVSLQSLDNTPVTSSSSTLIGLPINDTTFVNIPTAFTNDSIELQLKPHTGDQLQYFWVLGNGQTLNTSTGTLNYAYPKAGTYNATVIVYNSATSKSQSAIITVFDKVKILSFAGTSGSNANTPVPLTVTMTSGSDFNCTLSGSNVTNQTQSFPNLVFNQMWSNDGNYTVRVDCANAVSNDFKTWTQVILSNITGLAFPTLGGQVNESTSLKFVWISGSSINFEMIFENVTKAITKDEITRTGFSENITVYSLGIYVVALRAKNAMSDVILVANLTYAEKITGAEIIPSKISINNGSEVTFDLRMLTGSAVQVNFTYPDGSNSTFLSSQFYRWINNYTTKFTFNMVGNFNISAICSNVVNTEVPWVMVYVVTELGQYVINSAYGASLSIQVSLNRTSGPPASMANITIDWKDGTFTNVSYTNFKESDIYTHTYTTNGLYNVTILIQNPVSNVSLSDVFDVINAISNFQNSINMKTSWPGNPLVIQSSFDKGDNVLLTFTQGDGTPATTRNFKYITSPMVQQFNYTYNAVGNYTWNVTACNRIGCVSYAEVIIIMFNIDIKDFQFVTNGNIEYLTTNSEATISFTGTNFPTSLLATITYTDGSAPLQIGLTKAMMPHKVSKNITKTGLGNVTLTLSNPINSGSLNSTYGVFEKFVDFNVSLTWGPTKLTGSGPLSNIFPLDQILYFRPNPNGKGTVVEYTFKYNMSDPKEENITMVNGEYGRLFSTVGTFNVTFGVKNPIDSASKVFTVVIGNSVKDTKISSEPYPLKPKFYGYISITWSIIAVDSCICVDLANGTKLIYGATKGCTNCTGHTYTNVKPVNNQIKILVLYTNEGNYEISVFIYTDIERVIVKQVIPVTNIVCAPPVLALTDLEYKNAETAQKGKRGHQNLLTGTVVDLPCAITKLNVKLWSAEMVDRLTYNTIKKIDLTSIMTKNITQLIVPPRFLEYGLYKFTFTVTMNKNITIFTFQASIDSYLLIEETPVVANLLNGGVTLITKSRTGMICFTPEKFSSDPDLNVQNFANWTWQWACQQMTETANPNNYVYAKPKDFAFASPKTGCFGDGPGIVNFTNSPCFYGGNMDLDIVYLLNLTAKATYNREGFSKLKIVVVNGNPPNIDVQCLRSHMCEINKEGPYAYNEVLFNPSDPLLLNATCTIANGSLCPQGIWILQLNPDKTTDWITLDYATAKRYIKGMDSYEMTVQVALFKTYPNVTRLQLCYSSLGLETNGKSCIQFYILPLPSGITCKLDKASVPQTDSLCVNCTYQPKMQFRYYVIANETMTTLGFENSGHFCSIIPYTEANTSYYVRVTNANGGFIDIFAGQVSVEKMNESVINSILASLINRTDTSLELAIAKGDFKNISQIYLKYVSILTVANQNVMKDFFGPNTNNTKTNLGGTGYTAGPVGNGTLTFDSLSPEAQAEYQIQRDKKSSLIETMTAGLNAMVPADIKGLHLVSSVVTSITDSFDVMSRKSQWDMSNKLLGLATSLKILATTGTRDDISTIASNLLSANFENDAASNIQINNGINRDIAYAKENYLDYDTNLESKKNSYMDLADPSKASTSLTKETNSDFQKKIALGVGANSGQTIETITKVLRDVTVIDDNPIDINTNFMQYYAQKSTLENLSNKNFSRGRSNIILPDICSMMKGTVTNCSDPNNPIGLEIIATPNNIRAYMPETNTKALPIPMTSDFLSLNLYLGNQENEKQQKPNGTGNFTVFLGRDPIFPIPDFNMNDPDPKIEPPRPIPGTGTALTGPDCFEQKLVMFQFRLNGTDQSVNFQMKYDFTKCTQFLVVGRLGKPPALSPSPDGTVDPVNFTFWGMIPTHTKFCKMSATDDEPDPYTFFVDNQMFKEAKAEVKRTEPDYSKTLDTLFFGVREMTVPEYDTYTRSNRPQVPYQYSGQINTTFRTRIFSTGCYFNSDNFKTAWKTTGCVVGPLTTTKRTQCICSHLSSFASGWIVAPNTIDFGYVFSNFDFTKNLTLFVTEIVICIVFLFAFILARRYDIKDLEKIGVTPLVSNDPEDMYLYELVVDTSIRQNAGTTSNVYFILSGEVDETHSIRLVDLKRTILKRGNVDRFLLAVPRCLGTLQYIRLWHDNSGKGKNASWYCNYFGITDLQTKEKFHFLVNNWFAVEERDGKIDRLIAVASVNELMHFRQVFARKMKMNLSEDHLWISVMARPPESRFTRLERVACCLLLLFLTMLTTCMFYQKEGPSKVSDNSLKIGPFALSFREVWIGLISNIIGFVPLFIVIELFRKSQLKHGHANKLRKAVEFHMQMSLEESPKRKQYEGSQAALIRNEKTDNYRPETPTSRSADQINLQISEAELDNPQVNTDEIRGKPVVKQRLLPWWTRIIAWGIIATLLLVAILFVTLYGIQFGDVACKKWISAMFISFFTSVLFTQPIKVVLLAAFFSLIFKKSKKLANIEFVDEEEELMDELGKRNQLNQDEEYLHDELYNPVKPPKVTVQPPPKEELDKARDIRLKELQMFDVFREIMFYLLFFCTLVFVTYSFRDTNAYTLKNELTRVFITPSNPNWQFTGITKEEQFWAWALNVLVPGVRAPVWYNDEPQLFQRGFITNRNNRLMGYAIIRQVRTKKDSCKIYPEVKHIVKNCYSSYDMLKQDEENYSMGWNPVDANNTVHEAFSFRSQKTADGLVYVGRIGIYPGGGYFYEMRSNVTNLYYELLQLKNNKWIDAQTRAIFVEFTTYNPNINLFAINTFALELPGTGGMWAKFRVEPANLLGLYSEGVKAFEIFTQVLYGILILIIIIKEIRNFMKQKCKYFTEFWNLCELFIIFGSFAAVAGFVYVRMATNKLTEKFKQYGGDVYLNFSVVAFWNENLGYLTSFLVFVSTLKFIRVLRFNKRIGMLGSVISYSGKDMKQFCIIFAIVFLAFVMVFYSLFMDSLYRYHTFLFATEASMQIALGKFEFLELYQKEPIFGPVVFACYVLFIIFVLLNMFIAILNEGFAAVKADIEKQGNDHELLEFIMKKFLLWTGINNTKFGKRFFKTEITDHIYKDFDSRLMSTKVDEFPEKVQQLLYHINRIIYDNKPGDRRKERLFKDISFDKSKSTVKGSDDGYETSRPATASSNIVRPKESPQMTPLD